ncbi:spermidine synthase (putrescine aminopropyltransferase) [Candidatus Terasakiella magnetica]|uniref:Polyamine aminopropyltransferase n=1 Tax=Candidatus Terasakiella magnetica TaxID=1867952 RepID=A0A1C3RKW2_9PROT|nr:polyamine aminopropyltransferase [Candidatus Terasakiella magnetica]SCA57896.1 spermidine synthase (putrescine aminopropyltransferase) [Candidatus Terasakiella magnetica]
MSRWISETLYADYQQRFKATDVLFEEKTEHQDLIIFENDFFGRVMMLDGVTQTTDRDEFVYHEMISHVPIMAHGEAKKVLIIGGGDGGVLREVLRHKDIQCTMVEIDASVVEMSKKYFPDHSAGAFENERCNLVIADGLKFVKETTERFDVIIVDSTDPIGPGEVLFTSEFYQDCQRCLSEKGILVTQNGVPFFQGDEITTTQERMSPHFKDMSFYVVAVPTYVGGFMTLAWASNDENARTQSVDVINERFVAAGFETNYYTPGVHVGAFSLPRYIEKLLK